MKKIWAVFFTTTFVAGISAGQYGLSGTIKSYYFNSPVASCFIQLRPESPTAKADSMYSDANGRYSFPDIWPGVYTIFVNQSEYLKDSLYLAIDSQKVGDFELLKKANVYLTDIPDTLKKAYSPIIVGKTMSIKHSLFIQPGVALVILDTLKISANQVIANGTLAEPAIILGRGENVSFEATAQNQSFKSCRIQKLSQFYLYNYPVPARISIDSSMLMNINFFSYGRNCLIMRDNKMVGCNFSFPCDSIWFIRNVVTSYICFNVDFKGICRNNNFFDGFSWYGSTSTDTITNNIFFCLSDVYRNNKTPFLFAYNDVFNWCTSMLISPGIGTTSIRNDNGEPCDLFLNIFSDPQISDSSTGALFSTSPCIRAGQNGTNIGVWQGPGSVATRSSNSARSWSLLAKASRPEYSLSMQVKTVRALNLQVPANVYSLNGRRLAVLTTTSNDVGRAKPSARASGAYVLEMRFSGKR
jgi:hypothetical protein